MLTPAFNYAGAAVCCCAVLLFAFVPKNEEKAATNKTRTSFYNFVTKLVAVDDEAAPLLLNINDSQKDTPKNFVDRMTPWQKVEGVALYANIGRGYSALCFLLLVAYFMEPTSILPST